MDLLPELKNLTGYQKSIFICNTCVNHPIEKTFEFRVRFKTQHMKSNL
jgi:hypothetical protein